MPALDDPLLALLPGHPYALILVRVNRAVSVLTVRAARLVDGLRLARCLLSFDELQREDAPLDELLPWAGNV